jgi:hypothetical protein
MGVVAVAVALAGCGGSSRSSATGADGASAELDGACDQALRTLERLQPRPRA